MTCLSPCKEGGEPFHPLSREAEKEGDQRNNKQMPQESHSNLKATEWGTGFPQGLECVLVFRLHFVRQTKWSGKQVSVSVWSLIPFNFVNVCGTSFSGDVNPRICMLFPGKGFWFVGGKERNSIIEYSLHFFIFVLPATAWISSYVSLWLLFLAVGTASLGHEFCINSLQIKVRRENEWLMSLLITNLNMSRTINPQDREKSRRFLLSFSRPPSQWWWTERETGWSKSLTLSDLKEQTNSPKVRVRAVIGKRKIKCAPPSFGRSSTTRETSTRVAW